MELLKKFGDPDQLVTEEDLIVLRLDTPWPASRPFPERLALDASRQLIGANQETLISHREFLGRPYLPYALFCGCAAFDSSPSFEKAAVAVLKNTHTLVIVHNRNMVSDLVSKFSGLSVLALPHNLKVEGERGADLDTSSDKLCQLKELLGTTPGLGIDNLFLLDDVAMQIQEMCPKLTEWQTDMNDVIGIMSNPVKAAEELPNAALTQELILGRSIQAHDGKLLMYANAGSDSVETASKLFTNLTRLEVCSTFAKSLSSVADFGGIRRLSLMASIEMAAPFRKYVVSLLRKFDLEELTLKCLGDVHLPTLVEHCQNLVSLTLILCPMFHDSALGSGFLKLRELRVGCFFHEPTLPVLLLACRGLVSLHLDGKETCATFLKCVATVGLEKLERLTLRTKQRVDVPSGVEDLRRLVSALPSLRYVATDSYGIRLFFENYAQHVRLAWLGCTICTAEFPKMGKRHKRTWLQCNGYPWR